MSNGKCGDNCRGSYVFAVIQDQNCWCSNYIPANQESTSLCSTACPGFPDDKCGNVAQGLYAYFNLGGTPSGTAGGSSSTSAPSSTRAPSTTSSPSVSTIIPTSAGSSTSVQLRPSRSSASAFSFSFSFPVSVLTSYVPSQSSAEPSSLSLSSSTVSAIVSTPSSATVRVNHSPLCPYHNPHLAYVIQLIILEKFANSFQSSLSLLLLPLEIQHRFTPVL